MSDSGTIPDSYRFDEETWQQLPSFLEHLPEPVCLHIWGDEALSASEREAVRLGRVLSERFAGITYRALPRRINYPYYPVFGIMAGNEEQSADHGVRVIGLPVGLQMTSFIAGIQAVAFRGQTLEPATRIKLHRLTADLDQDVIIELLTASDDEDGTLVAKALFGLAVASDRVRAYLVVTDYFPEAPGRYSATQLPHVVINQRVHYSGLLDESELVGQIRAALRGAA